MSSKYWTKKPDEKRAAAKGPRKILQRGMPDRRVVDGSHVTKGRVSREGHEVAPTRRHLPAPST